MELPCERLVDRRVTDGQVRVWDFFRRLDAKVGDAYLTYVQGANFSRRMPLWIRWGAAT